MRGFCVLHLSDLHMDSCCDDYSSIYSELIKDIKKMKENNNLNKFILVISGDIFNKGNIKKQSKLVVEFLNEVCIVIGINRKDIIIVPGNHDIVRDEYIKSIIDNIENKTIKFSDTNFLKNKWMFFNTEFEDYNKFYMDYTENKMKDNSEYESFGLSIKEVGECKIGIIKLNSCWFCRGDNDYQKLRIGKWQLDYILNKLKEVRKKDIEFDLTVAVMHHPLTWLTDAEQKMAMKYFSDENLLGVNVIMCGHVHKSEVFNWFDLDSSILTLISGIGWDASDDSKELKQCRYALYKFDTSNHLVEVWLKKTNSKGKFISDTEVYNNIDTKGHFVASLKTSMFNSDSYLPISTVGGDYFRLYPNKLIIEDIKKISLELCYVKTKMNNYLNYGFNSLFSEIKINKYFTRSTEERKKLEELDKPNLLNELIKARNKSFIEKWWENIIAYIFELCLNIHKNVFGKKLESGEKSVRVHARVFDPKDKKFKKLVAICGSGAYADDMTDISWNDSMIYHAFNKKTSLVKSINTECHQNGNNDLVWVDYITIPTLENDKDEELKEIVPYISLGISISDKKFTNTLYLLNYLSIEKWIEEFFSEYKQKYFGCGICDIIKLYYKMRD